MLGRRSHEGLITIYKHKLEDESVETMIANKHVDSGGRLHLKDRIRIVTDKEGNVISMKNFGDAITLLVG